MTRTDRRRFPILLAAIAALLVFIAVDAASSPVQAQALSADASLKSLSLSDSLGDDIELSATFSAEQSTSLGIDLDSIARGEGLADAPLFKITVTATTTRSPRLYLDNSDEAEIIDNPILNGGRAKGGASSSSGKATLSWNAISAVAEYRIRYRKLGDRPGGIDHTSRHWPAPGWPYYGPFLGTETESQPRSTIGQLEKGEIHAFQVNYVKAFQVNYVKEDGSKGFSARDAYVWPSNEVPTRRSRVATFPFFGYWKNGGYGHTICRDTFPQDSRGEWEDLIYHAFEQWEQAAPDVITVTRQYDSCLSDNGEPIDNDVPITVIRAIHNQSNEVYMVDTSGWTPGVAELLVVLHNKLFLCIRNPLDSAPACVISTRYWDITWQLDPSKPSVRALDDGTVDVLVNDSRDTMNRDVPGNDDVPGNGIDVEPQDTAFNKCSVGTGDGVGVSDRLRFANYRLMVHEAGHALGLSNFDVSEPLNEYDIAHPLIPDTVMNYDDRVSLIVDEPDCSPHPFDVMAVEALYQTLIP